MGAEQSREKGGADGAGQKLLQSVSAVPWPSSAAEAGKLPGARPPSGSLPRPGSSSSLGGGGLMLAAPAGACGSPTGAALGSGTPRGQELSAASKSGGSDLFDALLMAATGGTQQLLYWPFDVPATTQ